MAMVEVKNQGYYLLNGVPVPEGEFCGCSTPDECREKTMAYKILRAHNRGREQKKIQNQF